jgi:hypothetical protein
VKCMPIRAEESVGGSALADALGNHRGLPLRGHDTTVQQNAAGLWCVPEILRFSSPPRLGARGLRLSRETLAMDFRASHRGVQRGEAPLRFLRPPRMGARGLKARFESVLVGFASLCPPYPLMDSRLCG